MTYTYLSPEALRRSTEEAIARLELTMHQVKMTIVSNGGDRNVKVAQEETAAEALVRLSNAVDSLKAEFAEELAWTPPNEEDNEDS